MRKFPTQLDRRSLLRWGAASSAALSLLPIGRTQANPLPSSGVQRYTRLGRTEMQISDISFGTSRLRRGEEDLVRHALDHGINYFDSADTYSGGQSERVLGNAIGAQRDRVFLASKTLAGAEQRTHDIMHALESSLRRLQTDYLDVFFNHAVNDVARLQNSDWYEFAELAKQQGKIRYTGISGHGGRLADCLDYAIDNNAVDVLLVAHNFGQDPAFYEKLTRSWDLIAKQPRLPNQLAKAKSKDIGVIAMKTLMGARLNDMRPYETEGATFAQAAFRWTLAQDTVDALIISMTSQQDIDEYLGASGSSELAHNDLKLLRRYAHLNGQTYCRQACNDCEGACPYGVPIADVLRTRMYATDYQDVDFARREYAQLGTSLGTSLGTNASACLSCSGEPCRDACSHGLPVAALCAPTHRMLS
jgi:predicted aldo/keto reductase-like oxidoreductase